MKKLLIRGGVTPYDLYPERIFFRTKLYGQNVGNLVYSFGTFRALMTDPENAPIVDEYRVERGAYTDAYIDKINKTCSAYVIPLADAFRNSFVDKLRNMAGFIKKLKIPAIVVGVGVEAPLNYDLSHMEPRNEAVRCFMDAVLEKSAIVGVRGEHTVNYLQSLGYRPEKEVTAIGCPSMFCKGRDLDVDTSRIEGFYNGANSSKAGIGQAKLPRNTRILITNNVYACDETHRFLNRVMNEYPDYIYIPQLYSEIIDAYYGRKMTLDAFKKKPYYPIRYDRPPYKGDHVRIVFNVPSWEDTIRGRELAAGPRLHGGIMCMLEGVPTLMFPRDTRTLEVCEYFSFAHIRQDCLTGGESLEELMNKVDFHAFARGYNQRFEHYCSFLEQNGLKHTLRNKNIRETSVLDRKLENLKLLPAEHVYICASPAERRARDMERQTEALRRTVADLARKTGLKK